MTQTPSTGTSKSRRGYGPPKGAIGELTVALYLLVLLSTSFRVHRFDSEWVNNLSIGLAFLAPNYMVSKAPTFPRKLTYFACLIAFMASVSTLDIPDKVGLSAIVMISGLTVATMLIVDSVRLLPKKRKVRKLSAVVFMVLPSLLIRNDALALAWPF